MERLSTVSVRVSFLLLAGLVFTACSRDEAAPAVVQEALPASVAEPVGSTAEFDWYMQGSTPAGQTKIVRSGDGRVMSESFVHWNNREWTVNADTQFDEDGYIVAQTITGISPFKAPIDEAFSYDNGVASWRTPGESGSITTDDRAFYASNEGLSFGATEAFVRKALENIDGELPLFPAGSARVEKVRDASIHSPDGEQTLSLYAIYGVGFTPGYIWMDADMNVAAFDAGGYLSMIPKGWDSEIIQNISALQLEEEGAYIERLAGSLAHRADRPVIIENVDVVDVEGGSLLQGRHVMAAGGKIINIAESPIESAEAIRIDGSGKTLMPGMWDMHAHFGLSDGLLNIAGGITSVRDIGGVHEQTMEMTAKFDAGTVIGPNTYRAGFMDKSGPYASGWNAGTLEEMLEQVDFYADNGYMQIKLYSSVEPEWVAPIAERAHARGMRVSGHIPAFMSAKQAVRAGYDEIQHINMVFLNFLAGDREDTRQQIRFTLYGDEAGNLNLDSDEVNEFIMLLKMNDVAVDPTAAIFETMLIHTAGDPDPAFAAVVDHLPPAIGRSLYNPEFDISDKRERWARSNDKQRAMIRKLHDAGIQLLAGSDNMAAFTVHRELEVYSESGIANADVLRIATLDAARIVGVDERTGSIAPGKDADFLLVDGNPLEDISAIRRVTLVMKGDSLYRPEELYKAIGVKPFVASEVF